MKIKLKDLTGLIVEAKTIVNGIKETLPAMKKYNKTREQFEDIVEILPNLDELDKNKAIVKVKQKVMRKVQKWWDKATMRLYHTTRSEDIPENGKRWAAQAYVGRAIDKMIWLEGWMIEEIYRQMEENDPELDELWEEQKREEGL